MAALLKSFINELREENHSRGAMGSVNAAMNLGGEPTIDCLASLQGSQEESCMVQQLRTCFTTNLHSRIVTATVTPRVCRIRFVLNGLVVHTSPSTIVGILGPR